MTLPAGINKWGSVVLGLVALLLIINLVGQYRGMQPGSSRAHATSASATPKRAGTVSTSDLAKYDPDVHFGALKELDSRPLPDEDRNPFEFVGEPAPAVAEGPGPAAPPAAPPPPPPPPLKAVGYNELPGGKKEAMVTYNDDLSVVHEGDMVASKFKVIKIDPTMVVVEDGETHKNIELPFPQ